MCPTSRDTTNPCAALRGLALTRSSWGVGSGSRSQCWGWGYALPCPDPCPSRCRDLGRGRGAQHPLAQRTRNRAPPEDQRTRLSSPAWAGIAGHSTLPPGAPGRSHSAPLHRTQRVTICVHICDSPLTSIAAREWVMRWRIRPNQPLACSTK